MRLDLHYTLQVTHFGFFFFSPQVAQLGVGLSNPGELLEQ